MYCGGFKLYGYLRMQKLHLYLLAFLVSATAAVTTPLLLLNASHGAGIVAERPSTGSPDPQFHFTLQFDEGSKFPPISCLMSTVDLLHVIASEDFLGRMRKLSWKTNDYPEVGIVISPRTIGGTIERRFVIWGLSQGVANMIRLNRFRAVTFTLSCTDIPWMFFPDPDVDPCPNRELRMLIKICVGEGREVGTIKLVPWPSGRKLQPTQDVTQQPKLSFVNSSSNIQVFSEKINITTERSQNSEVDVRIMSADLPIPLYNVFLVVISVLVDAAELRPTTRLRGYTSQAVSADSGTPVRIVFEEPTPARTSPPYFQVRWLMAAVAVIPEYMVRNGAFQEAVILVELDGCRIANGYLLASPPGVGMTTVGSNVSVS